MQYKAQERWRKLCQEASTEQNPERLSLLVAEIVRLLDAKLHVTDTPYTSKGGQPKSSAPSSNPAAD